MPENEIPVFEYSGTARSGKGSIVKYLSSQDSSYLTEETGLDFRAITLGMIEAGFITVSDEEEDVTEKIDNGGVEVVSEISGLRDVIIDRSGIDLLYSAQTSRLVSLVAKSAIVQTQVGEMFRNRLDTKANSGDYKAVLLDGRNLIRHVIDLPILSLALRTFVTCTPQEAIYRECSRLGVDPESPEGHEIAVSQTATYNADTFRAINPVVPDANNTNYWDSAFGREHDIVREGVGIAAAEAQTQILFDTTPFSRTNNPVGFMLKAAEVMFHEVLNDKTRGNK